MIASTPVTIELQGCITTSEAAMIMGVLPDYVRRLVIMGALPQPHRVRGSDTLFHSEQAVEEYVRTHPRVGAKRRAEQQA